MSAGSKLVDRLLAEFVDRSTEVRLFCDSIEPETNPILVYWGPGGLGKTSLLHRMIHECAARSIRSLVIDWKTYSYDYLWVMRQLRDFVGPHHFNDFTSLVNYFTVPQYQLNINVQGNVNVLQGAQIQGSTVGDIAGIVIRDLMIAEPRADMAVPPDERRARLTDKFLQCISDALGGAPPSDKRIVFLDTAEKMSPETGAWLWRELFLAVAQGRLPGTRFVVLGRCEPPEEIERDVRRLIHKSELRPLEKDHIIEYLARRGIEAGVREALARMLLVSTNGNPNAVATQVDLFLEMS